jgi:hypothetical protein
MGEVADMIIEGILCEGCGEWLGNDIGPGFPQRCAACGGGDEPPDGIGQLPHNNSNKKSKNKKKRQRYRRTKRERLTVAIKSGKTKSWKHCSEYHFQKTFSGILVDWWPSCRKIMIKNTIHTQIDEEDQIVALVDAALLDKKHKDERK